YRLLLLKFPKLSRRGRKSSKPEKRVYGYPRTLLLSSPSPKKRKRKKKQKKKKREKKRKEKECPPPSLLNPKTPPCKSGRLCCVECGDKHSPPAIDFFLGFYEVGFWGRRNTALIFLLHNLKPAPWFCCLFETARFKHLCIFKLVSFFAIYLT